MNINVLKNILEEKKISQREISDKIGMTQAGFNKALNIGEFKVSTLEKIAEALGVPVAMFYDSSVKFVDVSELVIENDKLKKDLEIAGYKIQLIEKDKNNMEQSFKMFILELFKLMFTNIQVNTEILKQLDNLFSFPNIDMFIDIDKLVKFINKEYGINYKKPEKII